MDPKNIKTMEDYELMMKDYHRIEEAEKTLSKLKMELGTRHDNQHVGSGLGGNASELFFLMNHRIKFEASKDDLTHFSRGENNEIVLSAPDKRNMRQVRGALTEFYNSHPDKRDFPQEQLTNPSFLRDLNSPFIEVKILIRALEEAKTLQEWLDSKIAFRGQIREFFGKERLALRARFLKEMTLPENYFDTLPEYNKDEHYEDDPVSDMFNKHPVWGVRAAAVSKRVSEIEDRLLSNEDNERLKFIGSCPQHIALFVMRAIISIDRIVTLNLDENENCSFLTKINKDIESE